MTLITMADELKFSVLLSLYDKENPNFLRESLNSVFSQTLKPTEVILVLDGPINQDLQQVVDSFAIYHPELIVLPLARNMGLGEALNAGLKKCSYDIVARMDTDDVCMPYRFEKQIAYMSEQTDIDICGSWVNEFTESVDNVCSQRKVPEDTEAIKSFIKGRNPFNHPSVAFRKKAVLDAGGYKHFYLLEDWFLWGRMLNNGCKMYNFQEPLLNFRISKDMHKRRGGLRYAKSCIKLFKSFNKMGIINRTERMIFSFIKVSVAIMPNWIRGLIYSILLR